MERYVTVSFCGAECRAFENRIAAPDGDTMTIDLGDTIDSTAKIVVVRYEDGDYQERAITMADLRAYLEQRDAYVAASTAQLHADAAYRARVADALEQGSRLRQSAQIEEVK